MPVVLTFFFLYKQQVIRHEMKEKLEKELLSTITIAKKDVIWVKYKKEIMTDGRMFDVESYTETNGLVTFTGLYDDDETALNKSLEKNIDKKKNRDHQLLTRLFQVLHSFYYNQTEDPVRAASNRTVYNNHTLQNISFPFINILTPPPRV